MLGTTLKKPSHQTIVAIQRAFTLTEILVVMAIISIIMALMMPHLRSQRDMMKKVTCMNNLRQIGVAYQMYAADNKGVYPCFNTTNYPGFTYLGSYFNNDPKVLVCPSDPYVGAQMSYSVAEHMIDRTGMSPQERTWNVPPFPGVELVQAGRVAHKISPSKVVVLREFHNSPGDFDGFGNIYSLSNSWFWHVNFIIVAPNNTDPYERGYKAMYEAHNNGSNMLFVDGSVRHYKGFRQGYPPGTYGVGINYIPEYDIYSYWQ